MILDTGPNAAVFSTPGHETLTQRAGLPLVPTTPSYYDIPLLKKPVWSWEIGAYFFLGGLSAGSYVLARVAERLGGEKYQDITRAGTAIALAALAPCPPLLIDDLGHRRRFHHMLRVFKPRSPMSLGSWTLTAYSGILFLTALQEWRRAGRRPGWFSKILMALLDAAGLPTALLFSGYTGVLLSATATPVWCQNPWLGPLFTASALSNAVSAISLALELRTPDPKSNSEKADVKALEKIDTVAHVVEAGMMAGYVATAGDLARPLTQGKWAPLFLGAAVGLAVSEVVRRLPSQKRSQRWTRLTAAAVGLASGLALKWAIQHAGADSAADPEADRQVSRPKVRDVS